ncbi:MAG: PAS domain S-box protein [Bacteriovoracaceae bacterium]
MKTDVSTFKTEIDNKIRLFFEQAVDAFVILEPPHWKFTWANPATLKLFGLKSVEEFCSFTPWELSPKYQSDGELSAEKAKKIIEYIHLNGSHTFEWIHTKVDGSQFPCNVTLSEVKFGELSYLQACIRDMTEQKRLKQQLLEAQSISKIGSWNLDLITGQFIWTDEHYKIFEINPTTKSQLLVTEYWKRIHPDDIKQLKFLFDRASSQGEDFVFEHRVLSSDSVNIKYVQTIAKVVKDPQGKVISISGTTRDRSSDIENEEKFHSLLEAMNEGVVVHDTNGAIVQFNSAALRILNLSEDQLFGRNVHDSNWRAIKEDGTEFSLEERPSMIALKTGRSVSNVTMGVKSNQETRWVKVNAAPIHRSGKFKTVVTFSDITELVRAYQENKFVLDSLGIGVWKNDFNSNQLVWNSSMFQLYEVNPDEFDSTFSSWESTLSENSKELVRKEIQKRIDGKKEFSLNLEIISKDGKAKYIGSKGKVIFDENGSPSFIYGVDWDITKEIELERSILQERAKAMHNAKLASIGQLAAGVGHEINNPLAIISGQVSIIESFLESKEIQDQKILERLRKIDSSVKRISNIVKGLRTFARSDENQITEFDIFDLIQETVDMLKEIYAKESIEIKIIGDHKKSFIQGNRGRIQQVLFNLISNAKDATSGQALRLINLILSYTDDSLELVVEDNGKGIPKDLRDKIFEPFFTTKEINKGTGIGLSIVSTIVKEHKGRIEVHSKEGEGARFKVRLPVKFNQLTIPSEISESHTHVKVNCSVLIVDDEVDLRESLAYLFSDFCKEVHLAESAEDAFPILKQKKIDLIISDIKMPGLDGFGFLKLLREDHSQSLPRFIFISGGVDMNEEQERIVQLHTDGMYAKPFEINVLFEKIKGLFPIL